MRRFPGSWTKTLTALGFRRRVTNKRDVSGRGRRSRVEALETRALLTATPGSVAPGDINADGFVDLIDLRTVGANWGLFGATHEQGDADGDGTVGRADWDLITQTIADYLTPVQSSAIGTGSGSESVEEGPDPAVLQLMAARFYRGVGQEIIGTALEVGESAAQQVRWVSPARPRLDGLSDELFEPQALTGGGGQQNQEGDANGDRNVDLLDLDILGTNFGATDATYAQGDFNGDGTVDLLDLDILGQWFGNTYGELQVSGQGVVGEDLTASIVNEDNGGPSSMNTAYSWMLDGEVVATSAIFTPTDAHAGKLLEVEVTYTDDEGFEETKQGPSGLVAQSHFIVNSLRDYSDADSENYVAGTEQADRPHGREITLRSAIEQAAALQIKYADAGIVPTISFDPSLANATITLGSQLTIDSDLVVDGSHAPGLAISGGGVTRVFGLSTGMSATIRNMAIVNGRDSSSHGGAISSAGNLVVERVRFQNNQVTKNWKGGGAIYASSGSLVVVDSEFDNNAARHYGGAIFLLNGAVNGAVITGSTFTDNKTTHPSGGLGGAVRLGGTGTGNASISNSTFVGNSAGYWGGAVDSYRTNLHVNHTTIVHNRVTGSGTGAIGRSGGSGTLTVTNTVWTDNDNNLIIEGGFAASVTDPANHNYTAPGHMLSPLGAHGGFARTLVPLPGSPLINAGNDSVFLGATDQRGFARSVNRPEANGSTVDIGAVELEETVTSISLDIDGDGRSDEVYFDALTNMLSAHSAVLASAGVSRSLGSLALNRTWQFLVAGDFNGDSRDDLIFTDTANDELVLLRSETTHFDAIPLETPGGYAITTQGWDANHRYVGDFDGDGAMELTVLEGGDWSMLDYRDGLGTFENDWGAGISGELPPIGGVVHVGDGNRDGRDDLIFKSNANNTWWVGLSQDIDGGTFVAQDWGAWFDNPHAGALGPDGLNADAPYALLLETYKSVHDTIELELYAGFLKGAEGAATSGRANAFDQAALLEDRLEKNGFISEIVVGTVEAPWQEVRDWLGAPVEVLSTNPAAARNSIVALLGQFDQQASVSGSDDIEFSHAWVELAIPPVSTPGQTQLDAAWKFKARQAGLFRNGGQLWHNWDYKDAVAIGNTAGLNLYADETGSPVDNYSIAITQSLISNGLLGQGVADVAYDGAITPWVTPTLPTSVVGSANAPTELGRFPTLDLDFFTDTELNNYTHRFDIQIAGQQSDGTIDETNTAATGLLATVSEDADDITVTYSADTPTIVFHGSSVSLASPLPSSQNLSITVTHYTPGQGSFTAESELKKQSYAARRNHLVAIGIDTAQHSAQSVADSADLLRTTFPTAAAATIPSFLHYVTNDIQSRLHESHLQLSALTNYAVVRNHPYVTVVSSEDGFNDALASVGVDDDGLPRKGLAPFGQVPRGLGFNTAHTGDFTRLLHWSTAAQAKSLAHLTSTQRSYLENSVIEAASGAEGVSALKAAQRAVRGGGQLFQFFHNGYEQTTSAGEFVPGEKLGSNAFIYSNGVWSSVPDTVHKTRGSNALIIWMRDKLTSSNEENEYSTAFAESIAELIFPILRAYPIPENGIDADGRVWIPSRQGDIGDWVGSSFSFETDTLAAFFERLIHEDGFATEGGASSDSDDFIQQYQASENLQTASQGQLSVQPTTGSVRYTQRDIAYPNLGVSLDFARHYTSQQKESIDDVGLGPGWTHSFADRLVHAGGSGPDLEWVTGRGTRHLFTYDAGSYETPSELDGTLTASAGEYVFKATDGTVTTFHSKSLGGTQENDTIARLEGRRNLGGDGIVVTYGSAASTEIASVHDIHDLSRDITFNYVADELRSVTKHFLDEDQAAQSATWTYGYHGGGQLASVTSPTGGLILSPRVWSYTYHEASEPERVVGKLKRASLPEGGYTEVEYYPTGLAANIVRATMVHPVDDNLTATMSYHYNFVERRTEIIDANGVKETIRFDDKGLITRRTFADGSQVATEWGQRVGNSIVEGTEYLASAQIDEVGARTQYTYFTDQTGDDAYKNRQLQSVKSAQFYLAGGTAAPLSTPAKLTTYDYKQATDANYNHAVLPETIAVSPVGSTQERVTTNVYDDYGRVTASTISESQAGTSITTEYGYFSGNMSNLVEVVKPGGGRSDDDELIEFLEIESGVDVLDAGNGFGTLKVKLTGATDLSGNRLYADAVRIYRVDDLSNNFLVGDVLDIQTIDDADNGFAVSGGTSTAGDPEAQSSVGETVTTLDAGAIATWTFDALLPGSYRVAVSLDQSLSNVTQALYDLTNGNDVPLRSGIVANLRSPADSAIFANRQQKFTYDFAGNQTSRSVEGIELETREYDHNGNVLSSIDGADVRTADTFDVLGYRREQSLGGGEGGPDSLTTTFQYDADGRLTTTTDALLRTTQNYYDDRGALTGVTNADGTTRSFEYDGVGNLIAATDERGFTTRYGYDERNRLIQTVHPDGAVEIVQYDAAGRVASSIDARGYTTNFVYDAAGRLKSSSILVNDVPAVTTNLYDGFGNLIQTIDSEDNVTRLFHDGYGRLTQTFTFSDERILNADFYRSQTTAVPIWASDHPSLLTANAYNTAGEVIHQLTVDAAGLEEDEIVIPNLTGQFDPFDLVDSHESYTQLVSNNLDSLGRVTERVYANGSGDSASDASMRSIYDSAGRMRFNLDELGRATESRYDAYGRLQETLLPKPTAIDDQPTTAFQYDRVGNIVAIIDANGGVSTTKFDDRNRSVLTTNPEGETNGQVYGRSGELIATVDTTNIATHRTYDSRGRIILERLADPDGSGQLDAPTSIYRYDADGNLASMTDALSTETAYKYDERGLQVEEQFTLSAVVDNSDAESGSFEVITGTTASASGFGGTGLEITPDDGQQAEATWAFLPSESGAYRLFATWEPNTQLDPSAEYKFKVQGNLSTVQSSGIDMRSIPTSSLRHDDGVSRGWLELTPIDALVVVSQDDIDNNRAIEVTVLGSVGQTVAADAIRFERVVASTASYDLNGQIESQVDARGHETTFDYDPLGRLKSETYADPTHPGYSNPAQLTTSYRYDGYGNLTKTAESLVSSNDPFRVTEYKYDARNRQIEETLDSGSSGDSTSTVVNKFEYDDAGRLRRQIDAYGSEDQVISTFAYDDLDRLASEIVDAGLEAGDLDLNPRQTDPQLIATQQTDYGYDSLGNLVSTTEYGIFGDNLTDVVTESVYDSANRLVSTTRDATATLLDQKATTVFVYDQNGNLTAEFDPTGIATRYAYDPLYRMVQQTSADPDGDGPEAPVVIAYTHSPQGLITSETTGDAGDSNGHETTRYTYDSMGRQTRMIDGKGGVTVSRYDALGNQVAYVDPNGNETTYEYDELNRLTGEIGPLGNQRSRTYDDRGRLATSVDRNERERRFGYDDLDRLVLEEWGYSQVTAVDSDRGVSHEISWVYDTLGRVVETTEHSLQTGELQSQHFVYDNIGRVTQESNHLPGNALQPPLLPASSATGNAIIQSAYQLPRIRTRWSYDTVIAEALNGYTVSQDVFDGSAYKAISGTELVVDRLGRISQINDQNTSTAGTKHSIPIQYDAAGRQKQLGLGSSSVSRQQTYDDSGRLSQITYVNSTLAHTLAAFTYTYDTASRINSVVEDFRSIQFGLPTSAINFARTRTMQLDAAGRLDDVTASITPGAHYLALGSSYALDANGNRTSVSGDSSDNPSGTSASSRDIGDANRLEADELYFYGYDPEGNLAFKEVKPGLPNEGHTTEYYWDHRNRLNGYREYESPGLRLTDAAVSHYISGSSPATGSWKLVNGGAGIQLIRDVDAALDLQTILGSDYTITRNTVIEFDYEGRSNLSFTGFGFDTVNSVNFNQFRQVQLDGLNFAGGIPSFPGIAATNTSITGYDESDAKRHYRLQLGDILDDDDFGTYRYLLLRNNDGASTLYADDWAATFSNLRLYESVSPAVQVDFNSTSLDLPYFNQSGGTRTPSLDGTTLTLDTTPGNIGRNISLPRDYVVTPNTVLTFEYKSTDSPYRVGIGLENQAGFDQTRIVFIDGVWDDGITPYMHLGEVAGYGMYDDIATRGTWHPFTLNLGDFSEWDTQLSYARQYLTVWAEQRGVTAGEGDAAFRNVQLHEAGLEQPDTASATAAARYVYNASDQLVEKSIDTNPSPVVQLDFSRVDLNNYYSPIGANVQNHSVVEVLDHGTTLRLEGNAGRAIDLEEDYRATRNTVISFELRTGSHESRRVSVGLGRNGGSWYSPGALGFQSLMLIDGWLNNDGNASIPDNQLDTDYGELLTNPRGSVDGWVKFELRVGEARDINPKGHNWTLDGIGWNQLILMSENSEFSPGAPTDLTQYENYFRNVRIYEKGQLDGSGTPVGSDPDIINIEHYAYADGQRTLVVDDDARVKNRYLYGAQQDQLLLDEAYDEFGAVDETRWVVTDHLGTVHQVLDGSGDLVQHIDYDNFGEIEQLLGDDGNPLVLAGGGVDRSQLATDVAFAGREWDEDVGLYYNRARWYDASNGRFISEDPLGFADGPNPYAYAANNPVNYRDPSGLYFEDPYSSDIGFFTDSFFGGSGSFWNDSYYNTIDFGFNNQSFYSSPHSFTGGYDVGYLSDYGFNFDAAFGTPDPYRYATAFEAASVFAGSTVSGLARGASNSVSGLWNTISQGASFAYNDPLGALGSISTGIQTAGNAVSEAGHIIYNDPYNAIPNFLGNSIVDPAVETFNQFGTALSNRRYDLAGEGFGETAFEFFPYERALRGVQFLRRAWEVTPDVSVPRTAAASESGFTRIFSASSGQVPPSQLISLDGAAAAASRNGIDMRMIQLRFESGEHFGFTSTMGSRLWRAPNGRVYVTLQELGLRSPADAVNTIGHELNHIREFLRNGTMFNEDAAIRAGNLAEEFLR